MLYEITRQEIDPQGGEIRNLLERVISTRKKQRDAEMKGKQPSYFEFNDPEEGF